MSVSKEHAASGDLHVSRYSVPCVRRVNERGGEREGSCDREKVLGNIAHVYGVVVCLT